MDYSEIAGVMLEDHGPEHDFINEVIRDFWICCVSREASIYARKEVLSGKAKFGITGDGKEVPQVALARAMKNGDWRSGYYRDQTLMFALGLSTVEQFFAQLYADTSNDPFSGGRQMNNHFATPMIDNQGNWLSQMEQYNVSSDVSCTAGQMGRALGLALASKLYRDIEETSIFTNQGDEVCVCTIGDASTSEGIFWETMNAAAVQKVPLAVSVWDDGYGISVPIELQTTKGNISKLMEGFLLDENGDGIRIFTLDGWDYPELVATYEKGLELTRRTHIPSLFHVREITQPQGHSTSGSHERYKSQQRLQWERKKDGIRKMEQWMIESGICSAEQTLEIRAKAKDYVKKCKTNASKKYYGPIKSEIVYLDNIYSKIVEDIKDLKVKKIKEDLQSLFDPLLKDVYQNAKHMLYTLVGITSDSKSQLEEWINKYNKEVHRRYHTNIYNETQSSALEVPVIKATYPTNPKMISGYQVLNQFFDKALKNYHNLIAFGEDVGKIGGVNQGFAGLQEKYGEHRVFDTGIREWSIIGQAVGLAMRGWRPIAEIQYLDYLVYAMPELADDLSTLHYRSNGIQISPSIIRTRGHRLEGIWHAGSPLGMLINSLRGIYICVPRNMTQAAGMYNTLLQSDDPGLIIECLNAYRLKEPQPDNPGDYTVPLGVPEVLQKGNDVTLVTYGSCVREAQMGMELLKPYGVSVELIDVQTLLPFDLEKTIVQSLKKTNRIIFMDEDMPGGATAFMMKKVLEDQKGYFYLDHPPITLTAKPHRPPYGSDGDYFSKPNPEDVFEAVYQIMHENDPDEFPHFFGE